MKSITTISAGITNKPIVSCAGDWNLFCTLEAALSAALPQDVCEWRRSYGRLVRSARVEAEFVRYTSAATERNLEWKLLERPVFHVYWTDCADIESFKTTLKDDIEQWLKELAHNEVNDWMIVHVETYDYRKSNKLLPRTTVLDKIKGEFASKQNEDRFISVINPIKSESRSAESWRGLVVRVRQFILTAYTGILQRFEEHMREQREKRNDPDWDFSKYFVLQEQLALVLEMLGVAEEALIQYDELDALFTQFILNATAGHTPAWLSTFQQPVESWKVVEIDLSIPIEFRDAIVKKTASLLDLRFYLLHRQCAMLIHMETPWEIARRCARSVHAALREARALTVTAPGGACACWSLRACDAALRACDRFSNTDNLEQVTRHRAPLLHLATDKLYELGQLCGLLPGAPEPTSEQMHAVVVLSAGMGDVGADRLKQALGSKRAFQQYYLELAELAVGTYKHIGRHRFARSVGRQLAWFYAELGETAKAAAFLADALRSYEEQGWRELAAHARLDLVAGADKCQDIDKYTKLSATIACSPELEILVRNFYFEEMMKSIKKSLADRTDTVLTELSDCFNVISVTVLPSERGAYITENKVQCCLELESLLPREILCTVARICVETIKDQHGDKKTPMKQLKTDSISQSPKKILEQEDFCVISSIRLEDLKPKNPLLMPLKITSRLHYKEDKTLEKTTVEFQAPKTPLKRADSSKFRKPSASVRGDYTRCMSSGNFLLKPGLNEIVLECLPVRAGTYALGQISVVLEEKLELLSNALVPTKVGYAVAAQTVRVRLNKPEPMRPLVAGLPHPMELVVESGGAVVQENTIITLKTSSGLGVYASETTEPSRELSIPLPAVGAFGTAYVPLTLLAQLPTKKELRSIEHTVWVQCPWYETATEVPLTFSPPLLACHRLLTSNTRKFVQVTVRCALDDLRFQLADAKLNCDTVGVTSLNPETEDLVVCGADAATLLWELQCDPLVAAAPVTATFSVQYGTVSQAPHTYSIAFHLSDYTTLFVVTTSLEPAKGSEFCRASQMCHLHLTVQRINETEHTSLMYEVLADQTMWAVCGRTAGVLSVQTERQASVTLDVLPLSAGHLPLPAVRLSKYIAAKEGHPRLEPFGPGQVYHAGKALQAHVLAALARDQHE